MRVEGTEVPGQALSLVSLVEFFSGASSSRARLFIFPFRQCGAKEK